MVQSLKFKNILVTGANGQLGTSLKQVMRDNGIPEDNFHFTDIDTLDITDPTAVNSFCRDRSVDAIVNLAAYTQVDKAESDRERAFAINAGAVHNLAEAALQFGCFMIQISTDYVFDGEANTPYQVTDAVAPVSVYGASKAEGERHILSIAKQAAIIRTAWLYSAYGNNFFKTMMRLGKEKSEISVVNDQRGCPTYAPDLAKAILSVLAQADKVDGVEFFHYTNEGNITWYDFAKAIMETSGSHCRVNPVTSAEYPTPTKRPAYSVLDLSAIKEKFGICIPNWEDGLKRCYKTYQTL